MSSLLKIKFVGAKSGKRPLKFITDGNDLINLPDNQKRAFVHSRAAAILRNAPHLYKKVVPKSK